ARPLHPDIESPHAIGSLLVSGLVLCWLAGYLWPDAFARLPTALFLCLLLGLVAAVYAFFQFHGFTSTLAKPVLVLLGLWGIKALWGGPVEHGYQSLDYDHLLTCDEIEANIKKAKAAPEGLKSDDVLKAWRASIEPRRPGGTRPRLVVVSTSGGAIRSA